MLVFPGGGAEACDEQKEHDPAKAEDAVDGARVAGAEGFNAAFDSVENTVLAFFAAQQDGGESG